MNLKNIVLLLILFKYNFDAVHVMQFSSCLNGYLLNVFYELLLTLHVVHLLVQRYSKSNTLYSKGVKIVWTWLIFSSIRYVLYYRIIVCMSVFIWQSILFQLFMRLRLYLHILFGFCIGCFYRGIGNDAALVFDNFSLLFFCLMFLMFTAFSAMIMACKWFSFFILKCIFLMFMKLNDFQNIEGIE